MVDAINTTKRNIDIDLKFIRLCTGCGFLYGCEDCYIVKNYPPTSTSDKICRVSNDKLLATILDALERNEDVFIRECRTPRDDRDGRWLVSQNCVTEKFTYIKEMYHTKRE